VKQFNRAGPCLPARHYMLKPEDRLPGVRERIEAGEFFSICGPRLSGRTTLVRSLAANLNRTRKFAAVVVSLESFTRPAVEIAVPQILQTVAERAEDALPLKSQPPDAVPFLGSPDIGLRRYLSAWAKSTKRRVVLFLDEFDMMPAELQTAVLRQLREGYMSRPAPFAHSVALVGRDDMPLRWHGLAGTTPVNLAAGAAILRNFTAREVIELCKQHTDETGQRFVAEAAAQIHEYTRGQPWLVNALAGMAAKEFASGRHKINAADVDEARDLMLHRQEGHLWCLARALDEEPVRRILEPILVGAPAFQPSFEADFARARALGLVEESEDGGAAMANPIYAEFVPRALVRRLRVLFSQEVENYTEPGARLDLAEVLRAFQSFWRRRGEAAASALPYPEAAPHLILFGFLQQIGEQGGCVEPDFSTGAGRTEFLIRWPDGDGEQLELVELMIRREPKHPLLAALGEPAQHLERLGLEQSFVVIFDFRSEVGGEEKIFQKTIKRDGKTFNIFGV